MLDLRTNTLHGAVLENLDGSSFGHDHVPHARVQSRRAASAYRPSRDCAWRALSPTPLAACAERTKRCFPVTEPSDCDLTMTKSSGSHWKMELQNEEVPSVLV